MLLKLRTFYLEVWPGENRQTPLPPGQPDLTLEIRLAACPVKVGPFRPPVEGRTGGEEEAKQEEEGVLPEAGPDLAYLIQQHQPHLPVPLQLQALVISV